MAITRDAFLYMDPKAPMGAFGQCSTCKMWTGHTCEILGPNFPVAGSDSCGLYVHKLSVKGEDSRTEMNISPQEAGFVRRQVRCENCAAFRLLASRCHLFERLNQALPDLFRLDPMVDPQGCCNAQQPKKEVN